MKSGCTSHLTSLTRRRLRRRGPLLLLLALSTATITSFVVSQEVYSQELFETVAENRTSDDFQDERLFLDADTLTFDSNRNIVTVSGNVQIFFAGNTLEADRVVYDRDEGTIMAMGKVRIIEENSNVVRAEEVKLSEDFKNGFISALQIDAVDETFFAAASGEYVDGKQTILNRGVYSVCAVCRVRPGRVPTWRIKAEKIIIDDETRTISYEDASFEFIGVPIAYLPKFSHVDPRVKQKEGLLGPQFVINGDLGVGVGVPYYRPVGKNADITITPTVLSNQGLLTDVEWRQRFRNGAYSLQLSGIRQLDASEFSGTTGDRALRGGARSSGEFALNSQWQAGWDVLAISDRLFPEDYDRLTERVDRFRSNAFLTGLSNTKYFDGRAQFFNILDEDDAFSGNLQRQQAVVHPSIDYDGIIDRKVAGGQVSFTTNVTSLSRLDEDINVVNGDAFLDGASGTQGRVSAEVEWKRQFIAPGGHVITPSVAVRGDAQAFNQTGTTIAGLAETDQVARGLVTGGLEWRYPLLVQSGSTSHVVEPIAQFFTSPNEGQIDRFLNEDSQTVLLDDTNIFQRDRFNGFDRAEGGTRANVGLTHQGQWTNWLTSDFLVGQSFHLAGLNSFTEQGVASVYSQNGLNTDRSDIVTRIGLTAVDRYGVIARGRFSNDLDDAARGDFTAFYDSNLVDLSLGYTFIKEQPLDDLERSSQINGGFSILAHEYVTLFGDGRYDLDDERFVSNRLGLAYDDNQLRVSLAYFQDFDEDGERDGEGVELRFNLRTLGGS